MLQSEKTARWVLASPLILFLILLVLFPAFYAFFISFQHMTLGSGVSPFNGLSNYLEVLGDGGFWSSLSFTIKYTLITVTLEMIFGFGLALLFDRYFPGKKMLLSILLLPIMVAPALMGVMFRLILNENIGTVTYLLSLFNMELNLFSPDTVVPLLIVLDTIQWIPFTFLILYSGLQGVDKGLYEAAAIDGASYWKTVWKIIVPVLSPIVYIAAFLRGIDAFRTFDVIYVLTNGGPGNKTTTVSIYIYKLAFKQGNFGAASAASILIAVVLLIILPFIIKRLIKN